MKMSDLLDREQVLKVVDKHIKRARNDCVAAVVYGWLSGLRDDVAELQPVEKEPEQKAQTLPPLPPRVDWTDEDVRAYGLACIKAYRQAATVNKKDSA